MAGILGSLEDTITTIVVYGLLKCVFMVSLRAFLSFFQNQSFGGWWGPLGWAWHYFVKAPVVNEPSSCRELSDGME